ncbi:unnamed protein product [Rotaria sp. Silwood1]|nr:unnamed protein product [Rotaria sp. Silwood1]CAF4846078.1 unnamed protein product [Rotaria sp. Silwood1]
MQFTSEECAQFCARNGIRHIRTAPGLHNGGKMSNVLSKFLFYYRSTPHATTNISPVELFLKRQLRPVLDLLHPNATDASTIRRKRYKLNFDRHTKQHHFYEGNKVLVRDFRKNPNKIRWIPSVLIDCVGSRMWTVKVEEQVQRRHENQIKHRQWSSSDEDVITMNILISTIDQDEDTSASSSSSEQESTTIRRLSRIKKPVHGLIEEI